MHPLQVSPAPRRCSGESRFALDLKDSSSPRNAALNDPSSEKLVYDWCKCDTLVAKGLMCISLFTRWVLSSTTNDEGSESCDEEFLSFFLSWKQS
ncbi:hypothetical protein TNCV_220781 [Trichonephila clavipes]|nr:hypothetical protein TNCV_220781 [Trichonephila clavipes]